MKKKTFMAALTGGIGCGKSFVLEMFARLGAVTVSADALARDLRNRPEVAARIADVFGPEVLTGDGTGGVDAAKIAGRVFSDPEARKLLEEIMHPLIRAGIREFAEKIPDAGVMKISVVEVPLLFESGWENDFDCTVAVWSRESMISERMTARKWDAGELSRRAASQLSADAKLHKAQYGIINNGSAESVEKQCAELMDMWKTMEE